MALFRLAVYDEDMFGEPNFLGAAPYPAAALLSGYRNTGLLSFPAEHYNVFRRFFVYFSFFNYVNNYIT